MNDIEVDDRTVALKDEVNLKVDYISMEFEYNDYVYSLFHRHTSLENYHIYYIGIYIWGDYRVYMGDVPHDYICPGSTDRVEPKQHNC